VGARVGGEAREIWEAAVAMGTDHEVVEVLAAVGWEVASAGEDGAVRAAVGFLREVGDSASAVAAAAAAAA
jgi:hypothetical protein